VKTLPPLAAVTGFLAVVARWGVARRIEQEVAEHLPRGPGGVVTGADPVALNAGDHAALLLHGFGDTPQSLRALAAYLHAHGWTVRVPLLPGHGRSLREFSSSRAADWVGSASAEYDHLHRTHSLVTIIGQSMGGALATLLAAENATLPALVLLAPYLTMMPKVARIARRYRLVSVLAPYVRSRTDASIWDPAAKAKSLGYGVTPPKLLAELAHIAHAAWDAAPRVTSPTLMLQSRDDNRITREDAEKVFERLGAATKELVWMEGCGHVIAVDYGREQVFTRSEEWLRRNATRSHDTGRASV